jgi:hypothetical protein
VQNNHREFLVYEEIKFCRHLVLVVLTGTVTCTSCYFKRIHGMHIIYEIICFSEKEKQGFYQVLQESLLSHKKPASAVYPMAAVMLRSAP